ncbi:MAG: hypothetical protein ACYTBJ_00860 [Planctomycetota bacterium]
MNKFEIINEMYNDADRLRSELFDLRKKACPHPESARTIDDPHHWSSWPDYGTDPGAIRCEDCNTIIGKNWGDYKARKGVKTCP